MGAPHGHALHYHGHSPLHRLPAHVKIVALVGYVLAVVATPRGIYWPYAAHLLALACAVVVSRVPFGHLARRMVIEVPFVVFALVLPLVATGERVAIGPIEVSQSGLEAAAALLAKGTLGVLASLLLAATTEARDIIAGFEKLRMPQPLVQIIELHAPLHRGRGGGPRSDADRPGVEGLPGAVGAAVARARSNPRHPLHPVLRAWGAGPPGHAVTGLHRPHANAPTLTATGTQWALGGVLPLACALVSLTALVAP